MGLVLDGVRNFAIKEYDNKYLNISKCKDGKDLITFLVPRNANSSLMNMHLYYSSNKHIYSKDTSYPFTWWKCNVSEHYIDISKFPNKFIFVVVRDPLDRILKSQSYVANKKYQREETRDVNVYLKDCIETLELYHSGDKFVKANIDRHILPQFDYYNHDNVDMYVHISTLDDFLNKENITFKPKVNMLSDWQRKTYLTDDRDPKLIERLREVLEPEYRIYNEIMTSNKIYLPTK